MAAASDIDRDVLLQIRSGRRTRIQKRTERRILAVGLGARSDYALVPAGPTQKRIRLILEEGFRKKQLAQWMGHARCLTLGRDRVRAYNAMKVERFYRLMVAC